MSRTKITVIEALFNNDVGGRRNRMDPVSGRYRPRVQLPIKAAKRQAEQQLTPPLPKKISKKVSTASKPNANSLRVPTADLLPPSRMSKSEVEILPAPSPALISQNSKTKLDY